MSKKPETIALQSPVTDNKVTLIEAMQRRRTNRDFAATPVSLEDLSGLFWAAYGANRQDGHKTVPAAWGLYALDIYAVTAEGAYLYDPATNSLQGVVAGDLRSATGMQDYAATAPLDIVIFVNEDRLKLPDKDMNKVLQRNAERVAALDAGAVTENIYLYCAAYGLNVVERMLASEDTLRKSLGVSRHCDFVVAMSVGYAPN